MKISKEDAEWLKNNKVICLKEDIYFIRKDEVLKFQVEFFHSLSLWKLLKYWWTAKRNPLKAKEISDKSMICYVKENQENHN